MQEVEESTDKPEPTPHNEAIALGEKLLKERPDSALVHVNLMDAYFKIKEQDSINLLKSNLHAKMAMICGHNTGYVQHRLVVNLESMWLIENAIQVCEIVLNPSFHFSKHGAGTKDEYAKGWNGYRTKYKKANPLTRPCISPRATSLRHSSR